MLFGYPCPNNTYGRAINTYGLVTVECTRCLDYTHTAGAGSTSAFQCVTDVGYGWENGLVAQCDYGYYNPGNNHNPCSYCGDGYNTSSAAVSISGEVGSDSQSDCKFDFGYHNGTSNNIEPCLRGTYKDLIGNTHCTMCPAGTSTSLTLAAISKADWWALGG
jgi:hypothetical protein